MVAWTLTVAWRWTPPLDGRHWTAAIGRRHWTVSVQTGPNRTVICTKVDDQYDSVLLSYLKTVQFRPLLTYSFCFQAIHFMITGSSTFIGRPVLSLHIFIYGRPLSVTSTIELYSHGPCTLDLTRSTIIIAKTGRFDNVTDKKLSAGRICIFDS